MSIMDEGSSLLHQMQPMKSLPKKNNRIAVQQLSMLQRLKILKGERTQLLLPAPSETHHLYPVVGPLHQQYHLSFSMIDPDLLEMVHHQDIWNLLFKMAQSKRKHNGGFFVGNSQFLDLKGTFVEGKVQWKN